MATSVFEAAEDLIRTYDAAAIGQLTDPQLSAQIAQAESLARVLLGLQVATAAELADRSRRELGPAGLSQRNGFPRPEGMIESIARISGAEASRRIQLGSAIRARVSLTGEPLPARFPVLAEAVADGRVGAEAATIIVRTLDEVRRVAAPEDLDVAEAGLVEHAEKNRVLLVTDLAIVVRDRLDPDGVLDREEETRLRRGFRLGRERNGIVPATMGLEPLAAALLKAEFDKSNAPGVEPRFLTDDDRRNGTVTAVDEAGVETITVRDPRSRDQRQYDVVVGLLKAGMRNTGFEPGQLRSTAEVVAHVALADLEAGRGIGSIDGVQESVSVRTIERILCDATFRKIVLGNEGEVLAFGKARYPFSSAQRKSIISRDGDTCLICDTPVAWADAHHVQEFYTHGAVGETNVDNGVMLCGPDHDLVHHGGWQIRMDNGIPHVLAPPEVDPSQTWRRAGKSRIRLRRTG